MGGKCSPGGGINAPVINDQLLNIQATQGVPNSRTDLYHGDKLIQSRWYGVDGWAILDRRFEHGDSRKTHKFPHDHEWEWRMYRGKKRFLLKDWTDDLNLDFVKEIEMLKSNTSTGKKGHCSVCGNPVMADMIGNGETCPECGWRQDAAAKELPDQILLANKVSLEKARRLYREGKPIRPDFNDFCDFCDLYKEVEFVYDHHSYAVVKNRHGGIVLIDCDNQMQLGEFANLEVFMVKAQVNGVLIRELWPKIENFEWVD